MNSPRLQREAKDAQYLGRRIHDTLAHANAHLETPSAPPASIPFAQYKRVLHWLVPYWKSLCAVVALGLLSTGLSLLQPYISRALIAGKQAELAEY